DTGTDPQGPYPSSLYARWNAGKFSDLPGRADRRPGDGAAETFISSAGGRTGLGQDDSRSAGSPERSNPIVIGRNYTPFRCNCGLADGLMEPGWRSVAIPIPSQGKLHFPCAASQLSFCSSRPGPKRTPLPPWTESTTEYDSKPFVKSNPDGRFLFWM